MNHLFTHVSSSELKAHLRATDVYCKILKKKFRGEYVLLKLANSDFKGC